MEDDMHSSNSAERQAQYEHELQLMDVPIVEGIGPDGPPAPVERIVHLDLKGAPPKLSFLKQLLPMLKVLGATGLLVEYEDMFPFEGPLSAIAARNAYNPEELKDFLKFAFLQGFTVMPLVQTFGHLEYVLKLQEFADLRELPESPQAICPSRKESIALLEAMLRQVIEFHLQVAGSASFPGESSKFTHLHIGCDEVFRMGECSLCQQRSRPELFLSHVTTMAHYVHGQWPQLQVVIWDDMLRTMTLPEIQHSNIGNCVQPMIWVYGSEAYHFRQPQLWDMYAKVFPAVWAASAYKGAFGESLMIPPIQRHLENNLRWLATISNEGGRFLRGFKGIALTGWQRYDHFAVLCELLPVGVPSLMVSLSTLAKGYFSTNPQDNELLRVLENTFQSDDRPLGSPWIELQHGLAFSLCSYPGSRVYQYVLRLSNKLTEARNYVQHLQEKSAWLSDYNVRHSFSSPLQVRAFAAHTSAFLNELSAMAREGHEILFEVYDVHTISEFVEQNVYPLVVALQRQLANAENLLQHNTWPQRPLPMAPALLELNLIPDPAGNEDAFGTQ